jgi:predicted glycogen debranching enzyme
MKLPSVTFNPEVLSRFEDAIQKEWLVTNGLGGYASSTVLGINTRKYHGLLVAAFHPPGDRRVCLAKLDEEITVGNNTYSLGANEFQKEIFPEGYLLLKEFSAAPFPKCVYEVQDVEVQKTVFMPQDKNAVIILYKVANKSSFDVRLRVFPLVNGRHFHSVTDRWKVSWEYSQKPEDNCANIGFGDPKSALLLKSTSGPYHVSGRWVEKLYYREEAERGESSVDDCYQPGFFEVNTAAKRSESLAIIAVADLNEATARKVLAQMPTTLYDAEALHAYELERCENLLARFHEAHSDASFQDWLSWLVLAADAFAVRGMDNAERMVIAGFHWFEAWGRDAFVSLPGLMLVTGKFEDARKVFLTFEAHCRNGLIPNFIPDRSEQPVFNSVDATLWFVNSVLQYLKYTGDFRFVQERLWETLEAIVENHVKGTSFGIGVGTDGLLSHDARLTWMDATVDGQAVTPRAGKAVEVQALWYNALRTMELLAKRFGEKDKAEWYSRLAERARKGFVEAFWNPETNCLFDVVGDSGKDGSLRPNQVFAVALDFTMLDDVRSEKVVDTVYRELLTPCGLRTLAKSDPRYVGVYVGDRGSRDRAYHNGTVWPWLLGAFTTAFLKTKGYADATRECALKSFLLPLFSEHVLRAGLGFISEVFDGDAPHLPRGCIAQAWSVAEPLRAYVEDVMLVRPRYEKDVLRGLG